MSEPTNADIYGVLLGIKQDIGGLKATSDLQLKGLENHSARIGELEAGAAGQRGAAKVWTLVGSGSGALIGLLAAWWQGKH